MLKLVLYFLTALLMTAGLTVWQHPGKLRPNQSPTIKSFTASRKVFSRCPFVHTAALCEPADGIIQLKVWAVDSDGDQLKFECKTSAGKISSCGQMIDWNLGGVVNGVYSISVRVTDGNGGQDSAELEVTVEDCSGCDPPPRPCPIVTISSPTQTNDIKRLAFNVVTEKGDPNVTPTYNWTASLGKIIKGEHASEVVIDATGFEGEQLTVTVEVGGFDPSCSTVQSQRLLVKQN